jgi:hypothetical protein
MTRPTLAAAIAASLLLQRGCPIDTAAHWRGIAMDLLRGRSPTSSTYSANAQQIQEEEHR